MKRTLSVLVSAIILLGMIILPVNTIAESSYTALTSSASKKWYINGTNSKANIEKYNMRATEKYMVAKGYTFEKAGTYDFSGSILLDAETVAGVTENKEAIGFMIFERKSNTILYPSNNSDFYTIKNTELERTTLKNISGSITAKAGDEIVFLVSNKTTKSPALQVIFSIFEGTGNNRKMLTSTYTDYTTVQGKNNWRYYKVAVDGFELPSVPDGVLSTTTNGFEKMTYCNKGWWWVNSLAESDPASDFGKLNIGTHTTGPSPNFMTAKGYTVSEDCLIDFSGTVMLDVNEYMGVPEGQKTMSFMVIEKRSNTILYPSEKAEFLTLYNDLKTRTIPQGFSGSFEAKAGDELLFVCKNETEASSPSIQVIADVYATVNGEKKKVANTHEGFSNVQGKNGWRYYYASVDTFVKPSVLAKNIFIAGEYYESSKWYLSEESVNETVLKSYGTYISEDEIAVSKRQSAAIGIKAQKDGKYTISGSIKNTSDAGEAGFIVVKKATFEPVYPDNGEIKKVQPGKESSFNVIVNATKSEEYLLVFVNVSSQNTVAVKADVSLGNTSFSKNFSKKQGEGNIKYYFASNEEVFANVLKTEWENSPYIEQDFAGMKDVVFEPHKLKNFDDEKWMWYVDDWENGAAKGFMAVLAETAFVSTPHYSMVRSYTVQEDSTVSIYGNMNSEDIGDWLGGNPKGKLFDIMIFNSSGQILFPVDRSGFFSFEAGTFNADNTELINISADMKAGEKIYMVTRNRSNASYFYTYMYFQIFETPVGGTLTTPLTSTNEGFSDMQGDNGWNYYYTDNNSYSFVPGTSQIKVTPFAEGSSNANKKPAATPDDVIAETSNWLKPTFYGLIGLDVLLVAAILGFVLLKLFKNRPKKIQEISL